MLTPGDIHVIRGHLAPGPAGPPGAAHSLVCVKINYERKKTKTIQDTYMHMHMHMHMPHAHAHMHMHILRGSTEHIHV